MTAAAAISPSSLPSSHWSAPPHPVTVDEYLAAGHWAGSASPSFDDRVALHLPTAHLPGYVSFTCQRATEGGTVEIFGVTDRPQLRRAWEGRCKRAFNLAAFAKLANAVPHLESEDALRLLHGQAVDLSTLPTTITTWPLWRVLYALGLDARLFALGAE